MEESRKYLLPTCDRSSSVVKAVSGWVAGSNSGEGVSGLLGGAWGWAEGHVEAEGLGREGEVGERDGRNDRR